MSYQQILSSFLAFNYNSASYLTYILQTNLSLILSILGVTVIVVLNLKEEVEDYVTEEQNII